MTAQLAAIAFSGKATTWRTCSKTNVGALSFLPMKTFWLKDKDMNTPRQQIYMRVKAWKKPSTDHRLKVATASDIIPNPPPPSDSIKQFYTCINKKDLKQLEEFISDDCFFDDCSFYKPFEGKKEVMNFFRQLIASMGPNIEFKITQVSKGDDFTTGVIWHLEWNKKQIPFTKGCSFYELSAEGTKLVIKRAQVIIESPIKPGRSVLVLLKFLTSLFDTFPKAAEWFLDNFHLIVQFILKFYIMPLGAFISPILACYIELWKFMSRLLTNTLKILIFISKFFNN